MSKPHDRTVRQRTVQPNLKVSFEPYAQVPKKQVSCACCGSASHRLAVRGDRYDFGLETVVCKECGLIFTNPRPEDSWFEKFYRVDYRRFYEEVETPTEDYIKRDWISGRHRRNLDFIAPELPPSGSLLDIGCAEGTFLHFFKARFPKWEQTGIEPTESFAKFAQKSTLSVHNCRIEDLQAWPANKFNLITASHVLEHLLDPNFFFSTARRLLVDRGLLFIDVPDAEGKSWGLNNLHIGHVYHYAGGSLDNLLAKHGFETVLCRKGAENPQWTFQTLARKCAEVPADWRPEPVNSRVLARRFAAMCRTPWSHHAYQFVHRWRKKLRGN